MKYRGEKVCRGALVAIMALITLVSCGEAGEVPEPEEKPATKIAEIYFRYGMEMAVGNAAGFQYMMTPAVIAAGAQCVQNAAVSRGRGIYREAKLQSLLLRHVFAADLSSYQTFTDDQFVHQTAIRRLKALGFASYEAAIKVNNMIVRSLLTEYTHYARFRKTHDVTDGVKPGNLVVNKCTPASMAALF